MQRRAARGPVRTKMLEITPLLPMAEAMEVDVDGVFDKLTQFLPLRRAASTEVAGICASPGQ